VLFPHRNLQDWASFQRVGRGTAIGLEIINEFSRPRSTVGHLVALKVHREAVAGPRPVPMQTGRSRAIERGAIRAGGCAQVNPISS
jgi:hypothetical protein